MDKQDDRVPRCEGRELGIRCVPAAAVGGEPRVVTHPSEWEPIRLVHETEPLELELRERYASPIDLDLVDVAQVRSGGAMAREQIFTRGPKNMTPARTVRSGPPDVEAGCSQPTELVG
jgi:hypothetical protein